MTYGAALRVFSSLPMVSASAETVVTTAVTTSGDAHRTVSMPLSADADVDTGQYS